MTDGGGGGSGIVIYIFLVVLQLWCSFDDLTGGTNVLAVKLIENGGTYAVLS